MRRLILAAALWPLMSVAASAACPGNPSTCGNPMMAETSGSVMYATAFGVKADGVTSDDVALKAAIDACSAKGTKLILPPGQILLTGAATSTLNSCALSGTGVPAGYQADIHSRGTMFLLTSTTVRPFVCDTSWSITGVNFYWPNQLNGTTPYPPLISDTAATGGDPNKGCGHAFIDHVTIVNAYDGIRLAGNSGNIIVSNSTMYAVHDMFAIAGTGDSFALTNMRFTPGPWLGLTSFAASTITSLNEADKRNALFHVLHTAAGMGVTLTINNSETEAWRWGVLIDDGGVVGASMFELLWDGTGTLIETLGTGLYAIQNEFRGSNSFCGSPRWDGSPINSSNTYPCFVLNSTSGLALNGFSGGINKDFAVGGGEHHWNNVSVGGVGGVNDGTDYYLLKVIAGNPVIQIKNGYFQGNGSANQADYVHSHGIATMGHIVSRLNVQNNFFIYFNEAMDLDTSGAALVVTGNTTAATVAPGIKITGTQGVFSYGNAMDNWPKAVASACGTGCNTNFGFAGYITVGSTVPTTSGTLTLPWPQAGAGPVCQFWTNGGLTPVASAQLSGNQFNWSTGAVDIHGSTLFYNCPGGQ